MTSHGPGSRFPGVEGRRTLVPGRMQERRHVHFPRDEESPERNRCAARLPSRVRPSIRGNRRFRVGPPRGGIGPHLPFATAMMPPPISLPQFVRSDKGAAGVWAAGGQRPGSGPFSAPFSSRFPPPFSSRNLSSCRARRILSLITAGRSPPAICPPAGRAAILVSSFVLRIPDCIMVWFLPLQIYTWNGVDG